MEFVWTKITNYDGETNTEKNKELRAENTNTKFGKVPGKCKVKGTVQVKVYI